MAVEDSQTLLDCAINMLQELVDLYITAGDDPQAMFKDMLRKLFATMSDRASVNKKYNSMLNKYRKESLGTDVDLEFLFCYAHFLLGLSLESEKICQKLEKEMDSKIGRETTKQFERFKSSESAAD